MQTTRKIEIGKVYSAKVGGTFLPVRIEKSLGHGRYEGTTVRADGTGSTVKVATDAIRGEGQDEKAFLAARAPKPAPEAEVRAIEAAAKAPRPKKTPKERQPKGPRHSLANAAILVLAKAKEPMNAKAIVERATADGLYEPGNGKTPEATLYSAMLRDKKGRFNKAERGVWTLTGAGKAEVDPIRKAFAAK